MTAQESINTLRYPPRQHPSFTFHYASTLSVNAAVDNANSADLHSTMLLLYPIRVLFSGVHGPGFTFHYASTLSLAESTKTTTNGNLHSTMLLLYGSYTITEVSNTCIYIPLCFYFILRPAQIVHHIQPDLHSTMLLLYPVHAPDAWLLDMNLHSTMLLLYPRSDKDKGFTCSNLHSTMLLLYRYSIYV